MEGFTTLLEQATAGVPAEYFRLPIHRGIPIYRERVYCYELYHQLRQRWPDENAYRLNGEVDKVAHPYFENEDAPKPDLLVHVPGSGENYAVIEVKHSGAKEKGVLKDLRTLAHFRSDFGYQRAIYLIFGEGAESAVGLIERCINDMNMPNIVEVWLHRAAGDSCQRIF